MNMYVFCCCYWALRKCVLFDKSVWRTPIEQICHHGLNWVPVKGCQWNELVCFTLLFLFWHYIQIAVSAKSGEELRCFFFNCPQTRAPYNTYISELNFIYGSKENIARSPTCINLQKWVLCRKGKCLCNITII